MNESCMLLMQTLIESQMKLKDTEVSLQDINSEDISSFFSSTFKV